MPHSLLPRHGLWLLTLLSYYAPITVDARSSPTLPRPADPYADPRNDPNNPLRYIASNALTGVAFGLVMLVALFQSWSTWRWGGRFMLSMVIGEYFFALGLATRFGLHANPDSKGLYIVEYLFVVLSPCAFIAADYVLLGRLARDLQCESHLLIPARRITVAFITSDITTFLIQAVGGSLSVSANAQGAALTGSHIFLAGLALQFASFFSFTCLYLLFLYRVRTRSPAAWTRDGDAGVKWARDWRTLAGVLFVSCIGILIRSIYRVVELSQGYQGHLATTEAFFYGLDTLPLFIAVAIYVPFWPGRFIPKVSKAKVSASVEEGVQRNGIVAVDEKT